MIIYSEGIIDTCENRHLAQSLCIKRKALYCGTIMFVADINGFRKEGKGTKAGFSSTSAAALIYCLEICQIYHDPVSRFFILKCRCTSNITMVL